MRKSPAYPCNGGEKTIREVAHELGLCPETVRVRLKEYGGDMQKVWDYYAGTSVNQNLSEDDEVEQGGKKLMDIIAPSTDEFEEEAENEPEDFREMPTPAGDDCTAQEKPGESLVRLNRAINALDELYEGDVGALAHDLARFTGELRAYRARKYEKYVDWDAVAGGVKK